MKKIVMLLVFFALGCSEKNSFLDNFKTEKEFHSFYGKFEKEVTVEDLRVLNKTDELNKFVFNTNPKYYYGYKMRLDNSDYYLINYQINYDVTYYKRSSLDAGTDSFLCIYDTKTHSVVSKIRTLSSDPISSDTKKQGEEFIVTSRIKSIRYNEFVEDNKYELINVSKYKIIDYRFVETYNKIIN